MPTAPCIRRERRWACGLAGLLAAAVIVVVARHGMAPALAAAIVSGTGWTRRRAPGAATRSRPGEVSR